LLLLFFLLTTNSSPLTEFLESAKLQIWRLVFSRKLHH
jgi:hypothetical protein